MIRHKAMPNIHKLASKDATPVTLDVRGLSIDAALRIEPLPIAEIFTDRLRAQGLTPDARLSAALGLASWLDARGLLGDDGSPVPLDAEHLYGLMVPTAVYEEILAVSIDKRAELGHGGDGVFALAARVAYRNVTGVDTPLAEGLAEAVREVLESIVVNSFAQQDLAEAEAPLRMMVDG